MLRDIPRFLQFPEGRFLLMTSSIFGAMEDVRIVKCLTAHGSDALSPR